MRAKKARQLRRQSAEERTGAAHDIYELRVTLRGLIPPIWRLIQVPGSFTLLDLHDTLQAVMGWDDEHLHNFTIAGRNYAMPPREMLSLPWQNPAGDETQTTLAQVLTKSVKKFRYEYDFGDSWEHEIAVKRIVQPVADQQYPICVDGARACPPEDIGGVWGYAELLEERRDPSRERREDFQEWFGENFEELPDPEAFDVVAANRRLAWLQDPDRPPRVQPADLLEATLSVEELTQLLGLDQHAKQAASHDVVLFYPEDDDGSSDTEP